MAGKEVVAVLGCYSLRVAVWIDLLFLVLVTGRGRNLVMNSSIKGVVATHVVC